MNTQKLLVEYSKGAEFITLADIIYCRASDNWTTIVIKGQSFYHVCQTLKTIEKGINRKHFLRVHRSYLVNLYQIEKILGSYEKLKMTESHTIPVSRRKRKQLKHTLKTILNLV